MGKVWGGSTSSHWYLAVAMFATAIFTPKVFATVTDGVYTGTASGQYFTGACSPPGVNTVGNIPFSGASVTLDIQNNGSNVTLNISNSNFSLSGTGFVSLGNLDLTFGPPGGGNLSISAQSSGNSLGPFSAFPAISQSGSSITLGAEMISGSTANCSSVFFDWNSMSLSAGGNALVDPTITPGANITQPQLLNSQTAPIILDVHDRTTYVKKKIRGSHVKKPVGGAKTSVSSRKTGTGFMMDSITGLNAGDGISDLLFGVWASYSYSDFENDFAATAFDGDRHGILAGVDIVLGEKAILGIAIGYENSDIDTTFNSGEQETEGFSIIPYFGYLLDDTWSIDGTLGYTSMDTDQFRTAPGTTTKITSSPDADRWFGALNLNGVTYYDSWILTGRFGVLYANHDQDNFVESDGTAFADFESELGQFNIGGDVAYSYGEFEPFARLTYEYDWRMTEVGIVGGGSQPSFDDDNVLIGAGVRYYGTNNISGNFEWNKRIGRDDFDEDTITFTLRADF